MARASTLRNEDATVAVCSYPLREGESLKRLARSLGTDVDTLVAMNNLRSASSIGEGDSIYLPVRARELSSLLAHRDAYYAVKKGDTYYSIAKYHDTSVDKFLELHQLD